MTKLPPPCLVEDLEPPEPPEVDPTPWRDLWLTTHDAQIRRAWDDWVPDIPLLASSSVKLWLCIRVRTPQISHGRTPIEALRMDRKEQIRCYSAQQAEEMTADWLAMDLAAWLAQEDRREPPILVEVRAPPTLDGFDALNVLRSLETELGFGSAQGRD